MLIRHDRWVQPFPRTRKRPAPQLGMICGYEPERQLWEPCCAGLPMSNANRTFDRDRANVSEGCRLRPTAPRFPTPLTGHERSSARCVPLAEMPRLPAIRPRVTSGQR